MAQGAESAQQIWQETVRKAKDLINHRSFWEALENSIAVTVEEDQFVVGMPPHASNLASFLTVSDHKNAIDRALADVSGKPLRMRLIEGSTPADWENTKERDRHVKEMQKTTYKKRDREAAESQSWETLYDLAARNYTNTRLRQLPQGKARFVKEMLGILADAMDELWPEIPDEFTERQLARVIDRIANSAELPAPYLAFELERLRENRRG